MDSSEQLIRIKGATYRRKVIKRMNINFKPSTNRHVLKLIQNYFEWLENNYTFEKNVTFDITGAKRVISQLTGQKVFATFFVPYKSSSLKPYIKVATGEFFKDIEIQSYDKAHYLLLELVSHELQHYYQWLENCLFNEIEAEQGAIEMTNKYFEDIGCSLKKYIEQDLEIL